MCRCYILSALLSLIIFHCYAEQRLLVDQLRWDFLEMEDQLWNVTYNGLNYISQEDAEMYLIKHFNEFDQKLKQMPQDLLYGLNPLRTIPDFLFLYSELRVIEAMYEKFVAYQIEHLKGAKQKVAIEDVIYDIASNKSGVTTTMSRVYEIAYDKSGNIKEEVYRMLTDNFWCKDTKQSPQQLAYSLYNAIALNELKAYAMLQFAYLGNFLWDRADNVELSIVARSDYTKRVTNTINALRVTMQWPQDMWRCDPKFYIKGTTYDEFTRLLQGHIQNEVDMSSRRTCRETCSKYSYARSYGCYDHKSDVCQKVERCTGNIVECFFVKSHATICVSSSTDRSRRYDFVQFKGGRTLGKGGHCSNRRTVNSWQRWFVRCHYCMCLCDQQGPLSDRYVNLRPVMADVANNRVVTGLRLVKHNRLLHLQIQEGKLLPYGYVNESTVHWVQPDNYKITDPDVKERQDFFTLTYGERSMALDEIQVNDDNHVVTGVRFQFINSKIHFEIHVSPFDWHNGKVKHEEGYYIYDSHPNGRTKIDLAGSDVPTESSKPSQMHHSGGRKYVEFTHTDFDKDAAQTTIPFIDIQELATKPASPLIGAGIYFKGVEHFGGFIAPRIKTYNYGRHVSGQLPEMAQRGSISENVSVEIN